MKPTNEQSHTKEKKQQTLPLASDSLENLLIKTGFESNNLE